jgi:hypothetical protein
MTRYLISPEFNSEIFEKMCVVLESNVPGIIKGERLIDVDSSVLQYYDVNGKKIRVMNSTYIDEVSITSEVDLSPYLGAAE